MLDELVVYSSTMKLFLIGVGAIVFVIIGLILLMISIGTEGELFLGIIGIISVLFFGLGFIYAVKTIIARKPAVIINNQGITDHSSLIGAGLVEWKDIADVNFVPFMGQEFLAIYTYDQNLIINRTKGFQKLMNKLNKPLLDSQVNIVYQNLKCSKNELLDQIHLHWQAYLTTTRIKE